MKLLRLLGISAALVGVVGCGSSDQDSNVRRVGQKLTADQARILGFEAPASDWSTSNGSVISTASTVSQGNAALSVTTNGHTQLVSAPLAGVGTATDQISFELLAPGNLPWGTVELVVRCPSQNIWWGHVGSIGVQSGSGTGYQTVSFPTPGDIKSALESNASDITFMFVINGPAGETYQFDNLIVGGDTGESSQSLPTLPRTLSLVVPSGTAAQSLLISATQKATIDDRSTLSRLGEHPTVASVGPETTEFGADIDAHVDVVSHGDVDFLRSQAHLFGDVTTGGAINIQDGTVQVDGVQTEGAVVRSAVTDFTVQWPAELTDSIKLGPDHPNVEVAPGGYNSLHVASRSTVTLSTGEYFFNSVVFEPEAHFQIDASRGPVRIYVEEELRLHVPLEYVGGRRGHVLFGYLGETPALFEEYLVATVLAPNSAIELRRPNSGLPHGGQFFGKEVHVFSDSTVLHVPFPFEFICKAGDADEDGVFDCWDECTADPNKTEPGICDCGTPDIDTDGDLVPDCIDQDKDNPNSTFVGQCGEKGVNAAPAGTPCTDGVELGEQVCDGQGICGNPENDAPEDGCRLVSYDNRAFWICPSAADGGAKCAAVPGRALVRIDHRVENGLMAALAASVGTPVRIGAVDLNGDGEWAWADESGAEEVRLWTGGPTGTAYRGMYNSWSAGSPGDSTGQGCAVIDSTGKWSVDACSAARPYVCEQTFGCSRYPNCRIPEDEPVPNNPPYEPVGPDCIPFPFLDAAALARMKADHPSCSAACGAGSSDEDCQEACVDARTQAENEACDRACEEPATEDECRAGCTDCAAYCEAHSDPVTCVADCTHTTDPPSEGETCGGAGNVVVRLDAFEPQACSGPEDCNGGGQVGRTCGFGNVCYALEIVENRKRTIPCTNDSMCPAVGSMTAGRCDYTLADQREKIACTDDADCPTVGGITSGVCDVGDGTCSYEGQCIYEGREAGCDASADDCMAACFQVPGCGVAPVTNNVDSFTGPCRELQYCSVPYDAPMENDDLTTGTAFAPEQLHDEEGFNPDPYPDDFTELPSPQGSWADCADNSIDCERGDRHPWCNYNAESPGADEAAATDDKEGVRGKDSTALRMTFDPGADLQFNSTPLPFGMARYDALASVSATANVDFKLLSFSGSFELLDLRGELEASICRVTTKGSRLALLGMDFLPAVAGDTGVLFDSDEIDGLESAKCEDAIASYVDAVDRAKKALRDAQELVAQYKEALPEALREVRTRADLAALGELDPATIGQVRTFAEGFCEDLLGSQDNRPPGMEGSCAEESDPADTINAFIKYYEEEAKAIGAAKNGLTLANQVGGNVDEGAQLLDTGKLLAKLVELFPRLEGSLRPIDDYSYGIDLVNVRKSTDVTIVSVQFFIGPIPALLQVGASGEYGVSGSFLVELRPQSLVSGSGPIASAGATVTPEIGAAVTLFAGAGFSAGPLELSLGLTAGLNLVDVELPASVKAGLNVNSSPESRVEIPQSLASLASSGGRSLYPFNGQRMKYDFSFRYDYGVNLVLDDILRGWLDATAKVKFFFFSLKYSQRLVDFKGLPPVSINLIGGGGPFIDTTAAPTSEVPEPRIEGHFPEMVLSNQQQPWKASFEEVPFVELEPLIPLEELVAALPEAVEVVRDANFQRDRVGDVLYNNQCGCTELNESCSRDQDCCLDGDAEGSVTCFDDPASAPGESSYCSSCRTSPAFVMEPEGVVDPVFETCGKPDDCCVENARCQAALIPHNCRWEDQLSGGFELNKWVCDYEWSPTARCLPPLPDPWPPVRVR